MGDMTYKDMVVDDADGRHASLRQSHARPARMARRAQEGAAGPGMRRAGTAATTTSSGSRPRVSGSRAALSTPPSDILLDRVISPLVGCAGRNSAGLRQGPGPHLACPGRARSRALLARCRKRPSTSAMQGRTAARLKADYDLLLTQRLILQPYGEVNLYGKVGPAQADRLAVCPISSSVCAYDTRCGAS